MPVVTSKKRNSILGSLALMLALPALALNWFDFPGLPTVTAGPYVLRLATVAAAAVTLLAVLSVLLAGRSRRTGTEIPVTAVLVGATALAVGYYKHRTAAAAAAAPAPPPPAPMTAPAQMLKVAPSPNPPAASPARKPSANPPVLPNASNVASQTSRSMTDAGSAAVRRQQNLAALRQARAKSDAARAAVINSLESDTAYQSAKAESDAADQQLKDARATYPPGNPNLIRISQAALAAKDKVQLRIESAVAKDPAAIKARLELEAAQAAANP